MIEKPLTEDDVRRIAKEEGKVVLDNALSLMGSFAVINTRQLYEFILFLVSEKVIDINNLHEFNKHMLKFAENEFKDMVNKDDEDGSNLFELEIAIKRHLSDLVANYAKYKNGESDD